MKKISKNFLALILVFVITSGIIAIASGNGTIALLRPETKIVNTELNTNLSKNKHNSAKENTTISSDDDMIIQKSDKHQLFEEREIAEIEEPTIYSNTEERKAQLNKKTSGGKPIAERKEPTSEEIGTHRASQLQTLTEKYPKEFELISSNTEIDPFFYVNLLEMLDYWQIDDVESYINIFIKDGMAGLFNHYNAVGEKE